MVKLSGWEKQELIQLDEQVVRTGSGLPERLTFPQYRWC
jgi:hypothetical protein